ncbi:MAG: hypothetical protein WKF33_07680 [Thermoleophilaceae bacterium]
MRTVVKIALGVLLAGVVLIAGCAVVFGAFVSEVDKGVQEESQKNAVSRSEMREVKRGMSRREVVRLLGQPRDTSESEDELGREVMLFYNVKGGDALEGWGLTFRRDKLVSKVRV